MKLRSCIRLSSIHLLALAICTYLAASDIKSILITGWICSTTGIATGISAIKCKRPILAAAGFLTPTIAVILFVLEALLLQLGPGRVALVFCIVFIINQVIATLTILVQLNILIAPAGARGKQITMRTLMVAMVSFSVFFAIARHLLERKHDWLMSLALGLLGLTFVGITVAVYTAATNRHTARIAT
jgi:hypothetical protein